MQLGMNEKNQKMMMMVFLHGKKNEPFPFNPVF